MAKKKREDHSSTAAGASFESPFAKLAGLKAALPEGAPPQAEAPEPSRQADAATGRKVVVRRERAGRGGKTVTVIEGLALASDALTALAKDLKKTLGCGATVEDDRIVLQGELDERAAALLESRGYERVVLGTRRR